ncbi:MAG: ATP-binding protein [Proteobacteria bacterium]|nr:ATP-binding protein [Pseudomonadota bacterium]
MAAFTLLPFLLNLLGIDFGSRSTTIDPDAFAAMDVPARIDAMHHALRGGFTHTLLEWSAVCVAFFTVALAFAQYQVKREVVTPIIGIALFWSGCMDAFHALAADRLIEATADNRNLIPFTWAICRVFNALILITGVTLILGSRRGFREGRQLAFVSLVALAFGLAAYLVIHICATSAALPQTMFPGALLTRPWDVAPLLLFVFLGAVLCPMLYRRYPNHFAQALWLSCLPEVVTQLHMAFGSTALFDNHFNVAHFLKIGAYAVPCIGLLLDSVRTYEHEAETLRALQASEEQLQRRAKALERSNAELEEFAYVASHDLQEPLRMVSSYMQLLDQRYAGQLDENARKYIGYAVEGAHRMRSLIHDLLEYSRVGRSQTASVQVSLVASLQAAQANLATAIAEADAQVTCDELPSVWAEPSDMLRLLQNLIGNALKYRGEERPLIHVSCERRDDEWIIGVVDNGVGIEPEYRERVFGIFQRLHRRGEYAGTGVGLAIVKRVAERHGGRVWLESEPGRGSTFYFALPVDKREDL